MKTFELIEAFNDSYSDLKEFGLEVYGVFQDFSQNSTENGDELLTIGLAEELNESDEIDCKNCHLNIMHPFLFDNRKTPTYFLGVKIMNITYSSTIPDELEEMEIDENGHEDNFTPNQYRNYVKNNSDYIREVLKSPNMPINEILDAICEGDFKKYEDEFEERKIKRIIG